MSWDDFADAGWGKLVGLGMSLCHLDQVVAGLPVEERLLAAAVARLVATAAGRRRHAELLEQHHYLHHASAVGQVLCYVAEYHGEWVDPVKMVDWGKWETWEIGEWGICRAGREIFYRNLA